MAAWIGYLNELRLNRILEGFQSEQVNLREAMGSIRWAVDTIRNDIVNNGAGRGGKTGMHGFIAEVAETGIENARRHIEGLEDICEWINDNGPEDLRRGAVQIQQKFVNSGGHLSLRAVQMHLEKYPDFLENGGVYQIPKDHYEKICRLLNITEEQANRMSTSDGTFSLKQWREVHALFDQGNIPFDRLEPSQMRYDEVQRETYELTMQREKQNLRKRNRERKDVIRQENRPTVQEGLKAGAVGAVAEGGVAFCAAVVRKRRSGRTFRDLTGDDWMEIAEESGCGVVRGGIRGVSVYFLTNIAATPAAAANAVTTAAFGVAEQAHLLRQGKQDELAFYENSRDLCLNAAVSAVSSLLGQTLIPVPILGAVIGNTAGQILVQIGADVLSGQEQQILEKHLQEIQDLKNRLDRRYRDLADELAGEMQKFLEILDRAFAPDVQLAFAGSVELARQMGVPGEEVLDTREKIASYFLD